MSKYICILFLILCCTASVSAQVNLVPNPSFETIISCDSNMASGVSNGNSPPWDSPTDGNPDLFNSCSSNGFYSSPANYFGFQYPHSGNGYAGAGFYVVFNEREYYQIELDSPLVAQQLYCANFYVSLANQVKIASNNIGMYFSNTYTYISTINNLNFTPQIIDTSIISDTLNWTLISGKYRAQGGERYIIIGDFSPDSLTDTIHFHYGFLDYSYYYLDDISVMRCSDVGVEELTKQSNYKLYPNPNTGSMTLEYTLESTDNALFSLYAIDGRLIKQLTLNSNNSTITISATELNAGIYYYTVKEGNNIVKTDKLIIIK